MKRKSDTAAPGGPSPQVVKSVRYMRRRYKKTHEELSEQFQLPKVTIERILNGVIGGDDDEGIEIDAPPRFHPDAQAKPTDVRKCPEGHRFYGPTCYTCLIADLAPVVKNGNR